MADVGLIRKRLRSVIETARRDAASRRSRADAAGKQYQEFLTHAAVPAFSAVATVLKAEGIPFEVMSPSGGVRLTPARSRDQGIELELDTSADPPRPVVTTTVMRGNRMLRTERPVKEGTPVGALTEDDVIEMLMTELEPWLA